MSKKIIIYAITLFLLGAAGFTAGQRAQAGPGDPIPGSGEDPVAAQSYVQETLSARLTVMEQQVVELKARVQELQQK